MRAAKLYAPGDFRLVEVERPVPGLGEVLVEVREVGICASDVHWYQDGHMGDTVMTEPLILGHEFAGVIAEVGSGVTNVKPGDRVAVEPGVPCYQCDICAEGAYNICPNVRFCGTPPTDGGFREFLTWPARLVEPIPGSISMGEAAMLEPLAIGVYAIDIAGDIRCKTIGVLGAGAIGLSILQAARAAGCGETFATDLIPARLELARRLGAGRVFDARDASVAEAVTQAAGREGLDIVFEAAGENDAVVQATEMVRPGGLVILGGIPSDDRIVLGAGTVRRKGLTIRLLRRSKDTLGRAIRLVEEGKADLASYITHRFPLERLDEAFQIARDRKDGALRVIVRI
ncbi:MAG TPA: alcohol dehydrogenase catalytic domain-containing protein [Armatimonadota bacterium]|nr:alcohol dehydrogenase catalytic domain-containing protein [Armatimonadota bacterium]